MSRPAWRTAWIAVMLPPLTSSTTSWLDSGDIPVSRSSRASAGPEASASRQPRLPHWQGTSAPRDTCTWPMSPAVPCAPRWRMPPEMTPDPMPVATFTKMRWSTSGQESSRSPSAMMFTSLSTSTGASKLSRNQPGTSNRSQPGMIGGLMGRPRAVLDGPGQPDADREQVAGRRGRAARAARVRRWRPSSAPLRVPRPRGCARCSAAWMRPVRSLTAIRTCEAPTSTPSTTLPLAAIANCDDGRPPVETASPTGPTRPSFISASMRRATVDRARPVIDDSSVRVRGRPSRRIWNRSLATDEPRAVTCPSCPWRLMSVIGPFFHNLRSKYRELGRNGAPLSVVTTAPRGSARRAVPPTCSTLHGLRIVGIASTTRRKSAGSTQRHSITSSGAGSGSPGSSANQTGHTSFSTMPSGATARYRNPGSTGRSEIGSTPSSSRSRRRIADSRSSPGAGCPQQVFVQTPGPGPLPERTARQEHPAVVVEAVAGEREVQGRVEAVHVRLVHRRRPGPRPGRGARPAPPERRPHRRRRPRRRSWRPHRRADPGRLQDEIADAGRGHRLGPRRPRTAARRRSTGGAGCPQR